MDTKSLSSIPGHGGVVVGVEHGRIEELTTDRRGSVRDVDIFFDVDVPPGGPFRVNVVAQIPMRPTSLHVTENDCLVVGDFIIGICVQKAPKFDTAQTGQWLSFIVTNRSKSSQRFKARIRAKVAA